MRAEFDIPPSWDTSELGKLLAHVIDYRGRTPKKLGMDWGGGTVPALSANNVKMGAVNLSEPTFYGSDSLYTKWMTSGEAKHGDVLLTMEAPLGNVAQIPDGRRYILSQRVILLRFDERRFTNTFAAHQLRSQRVQRNLQRWSTGTTATGIQRARLIRVPLAVPPVAEQKCIAEILDTLDEAIRTTEQIVAKLKQVKQGLLHDLLTRGIDDNGELRDPGRHPEQFKSSPVGRVPVQWDVGRLEDWLLLPPKNGYSPEASAEWTGCVMLGLGCLTKDGFAPIQLKNAPARDRRLHGVRLTNGDLLMSRANTREFVGLVGRFEDVGVPCTYPDLMMRLVPHPEKTSATFMEVVLGSAPLRRQIQAAAVGTSESMVKISGKIVRHLQVAMPAVSEQQRIVRAVENAQEGLVREDSAAAKLRMLKQGLMEDLLTGRVRVTSERTTTSRNEPRDQLGLEL